MEAQKRELIESAGVAWCGHGKNWYTRGALNIGEYEIKIKRKEFDNIDDAVTELKKQMAKAVVDFAPEENQGK